MHRSQPHEPVMLDNDQIVAIATAVAKKQLGMKAVLRALSERASDSEGREALRVTIVIAPDVAKRLKGEAVLDTLTEISNRLLKEGEERFPIMEYATEAELNDAASEF